MAREPASVEREFVETRRRFAWFFLAVIGAGFLLATTAVGVMLWVVLASQARATEKALTVQLIQVSLGMILGFASVAFGVALVWVGITSPFKFKAETGEAQRPSQVLLQSAGPGIVLLIGGMVLVGVSLYKPIRYQEFETGGNAIVQPEPSNAP